MISFEVKYVIDGCMDVCTLLLTITVSLFLFIYSNTGRLLFSCVFFTFAFFRCFFIVCVCVCACPWVMFFLWV